LRALTQTLRDGRVVVTTAPSPGIRRGTVVVRSRAGLISAGTEGALVQFGRSGLLEKIRSQPHQVQRVLDKARTDGVGPTLEAVRDRLTRPTATGYCQAGVVLECGDAVGPFAPGDRVVTNGPHAEVVRVPYNLAAKIPDGVSFEAAAFTPLAAIALQGVRLAEPSLGETVVVFGLGLIGQLTVQIARANGCRCIGIDRDPDRVALAETFGATGLTAEDGSIVEAVRSLTGGRGADAVLMTLASDSDEPMHQAAGMSRQRGRIVLVGVTGLDLRRADFYEKELSLQVSCSYGPGRYDPDYEEGGHDYPLPFVRWTAKRNFEAVLELMADGRLDPIPLISHRFPIETAAEAYDVLVSDEPSLGILLTYPDDGESAGTDRTIRLSTRADSTKDGTVAGVLGAGDFARRTLLPAIRAAGLPIRTIVSSGGLSASVEGKAARAAFASTEAEAVFTDPEIDTVVVLTRHDTHASFAARALDARKHVFVEKPLALSQRGLEEVRTALEASNSLLMVGFNRRFAPRARDMKKLVDRRSGPLSLVITVNAGRLPVDHWARDPRQGGGRIVGEACHFLDLARFLVGARITNLAVQSARDESGRPLEDVSHLQLGFADGSTAGVHYLASGSRRFPKERVEAFFDGCTARIDNWRRLRTWGLRRWDGLLPRRMDKGHRNEMQAFVDAVRAGGPAPIPIDEIFEVSEWSIRAAELARQGAA